MPDSYQTEHNQRQGRKPRPSSASPNTTPVLFEDTLSKPVHVAFDAESLSSDGGAVLLAQLDQGIGLTWTSIDSLDDPRQPAKMAFTFDELIGNARTRSPSATRMASMPTRWPAIR